MTPSAAASLALAFGLIRIALGAMFLAHGLLKLIVFGPTGFEGFLSSQGLPALLAWPIILGEILGGTMIMLGMFARAASAALLPVLLGALAIHWQNGWLFSAPGGGWEYPAFLVVAALAHLLGGDGGLSIGNWSRRAATSASRTEF